ncbi:SDR family oxidoreductase [Streptomyces sp. NBC_01283]|uniref:SDR family oxidoreductase n=1 Tax=Streptomyces sp. NBC_01283 TaxID=2903812 RepID=UPI00352E63C5|nr:SDR family oxidoreductase [Streptomyces sp. NBC_01283]
MAAEHYLMTGATGFVGGATVLELLERTDAVLSCVVRARGDEMATERLKGALHRAAQVYGRADLVGEIDARCRGIAGDLTLPDLGVTASLGPVDQIWHVAASLAFEDSGKDEILNQNVQGTRHAVTLAKRFGVCVFNHVSTAYVSGSRTGRIAPDPVSHDDDCNNWYERSKVAAEHVVTTAGFDCLRIFRPSVVIGHSESAGTTSSSGLYGFISALTQYRAELTESLGDVMATRPLRLRMTADSLTNYIPVDRVAAAAVGVARASDRSGIYHLANAEQLPVHAMLKAVFDALGLPGPTCVADESDLALVDLKADRLCTFYRHYTNGTREFDLDSVEQLIGRDILNVSMSRERLADFIDAFVQGT